jgi:hypothetical protein
MTALTPSADASAPGISVIVATYNSPATLHCAISSLLGQDCADFEAWIVGDGCSDDTAAVVQSFNDARLHWLPLPVNSGSQSAPNNEGLRHARGRFVAYLGHDDLWMPWHLSGLLAALTASAADFASSTSLMLHPEGHHRVTGPMGLGRSHADQYTPPSSWLHRHEIASNIGGWRDPSLPGCGVDLDFQRRTALAGYRFGESPRLSVLKFPSSWWRNYLPGQIHPQPDFLRRIQADPAALERDLLQETMVRLVREENGAQVTPVLHRLVTAMLRRMADGYGRDRWPMSTFMHWRQQRFRKRDRPQRGLPPIA